MLRKKDCQGIITHTRVHAHAQSRNGVHVFCRLNCCYGWSKQFFHNSHIFQKRFSSTSYSINTHSKWAYKGEIYPPTMDTAQIYHWTLSHDKHNCINFSHLSMANIKPKSLHLLTKLESQNIFTITFIELLFHPQIPKLCPKQPTFYFRTANHLNHCNRKRTINIFPFFFQGPLHCKV